MKLVKTPCGLPSTPLCLSLDSTTSSCSSVNLLSLDNLGNSSLRLPEIILEKEAEVEEVRSKEPLISCDDGEVSLLGSALVKLAILKPVECVGRLLGDLRASAGFSLSRCLSVSSSETWTALLSRSEGLLDSKLPTLWGDSSLPLSLSLSWSRSRLLSLSRSRSSSRSRSLPRSCSRSFSRSFSRLSQPGTRPQSRLIPWVTP